MEKFNNIWLLISKEVLEDGVTVYTHACNVMGIGVLQRTTFIIKNEKTVAGLQDNSVAGTVVFIPGASAHKFKDYNAIVSYGTIHKSEANEV